MKISAAMFEVLQVVVEHDRQGRAADPDLYPTSTVRALLRRNLVRRVECGYVRPTLEGLRIVCATAL